MSNNQNSKIQFLFLIALMLVFVSFGCLIRTYPVIKERPDQETEGNQGYLTGESSETKVREKKTRTTYVTEVELGDSLLVDDVTLEEKDLSQAALDNTTLSTEAEKKASSQKSATYKAGIYYNATASTTQDIKDSDVTKSKKDKIKKVKTYVVRKGDTLEKISARPEVYGDKNKWYKIFKANKDQLKEPNKIFPGQVLRIPE